MCIRDRGDVAGRPGREAPTTVASGPLLPLPPLSSSLARWPPESEMEKFAHAISLGPKKFQKLREQRKISSTFEEMYALAV
eukprot:320733-Pyramimonas_sp.AAC.1